MSKLKILIVENEMVIAEDLKDILKELNHEVCGIAVSGEEALTLIEDKSPDLALLDIHLIGEEDGIELAAEINKMYDLPFIILTSNLDLNTIIRANALNPYGFLVKQFNEKEILADFELTLANFAKEKSHITQQGNSKRLFLRDSLFIRNNGVLIKLKLQDIIYLEADANYTQLHTRDKKFVIRSTLKELEGKLDANRFVRVHKSFLINMEEIHGIQADSVHIAGKEIPIGRNQYSWLLRQIRIL